MTLPRVAVLAADDGQGEATALGDATIRAFGASPETIDLGDPDAEHCGWETVNGPPDVVLVVDLPRLQSARTVGRMLSSIGRGVPRVIAAQFTDADGADRVDAESLAEIKRSVLLGASLLVVSTHDACRLAGLAPEDREFDPGHVATMLITIGVDAVLLQGGGDGSTGCGDLMIGDVLDGGEIRLDRACRYGASPHGVGRIVAAGAAAALASGRDLEAAVRAAGAFARLVCQPDGTFDPTRFPGSVAPATWE